MRHRHADLIHAWAEGAEIEIYRSYKNMWEPHFCPTWGLSRDYRIKPTPKPDVVWYARPGSDGYWSASMNTKRIPGFNLKLTFDGETGELKSAEVLK
jgi:hypothetical protein